MIDFFLAKKNKALMKKALTLGFDKIFWLKLVHKFDEIKKEEKKFYDGILISSLDIETIRKAISRASAFSFKVLVKGLNDQINRTALEDKRVMALVSPEYGRKLDWPDQRNSGLNHVLCKIAASQGKFIMINFKDVLETKGKARSLVLGRIMQNVKLCRKYKNKLRIASFASSVEELRSPYELKALGFAVGMSTQQAKECLDFSAESSIK